MAQPLFSRLHAYCPELCLDVLASPWVAPVLLRMPEVNAVIPNPFAHGQLRLKSRVEFARTLVKNGYQRAYVLPNSWKSALIPFFANIPLRVAFTGEARYGLVNCRHTLDKKSLPKMVERFAQLAEKPGASLPRPLPQLNLRSSAPQQQQTLEALKLTGTVLASQIAVFCRHTQDEPPLLSSVADLQKTVSASATKIAVLCPGAEYGPAKRWPTKHFATLARYLSSEGFAVWILGSAADAPLGDAIVRESRASLAPVNFCGKTSLSQAIDLIAAASVVVCNDSGLMHVAAALNRPLVAMYGSSSPDFTPPLSTHANIIRLGLPCSPCFARQCPLGHLHCLTQITPEHVLKTCLDTVQNKT